MINPSAPPILTRNEGLKEGCPTLCGTISQTLADPALDRFSEDDYEFLKFHGIYQQDDRDKRKIAKQYIFMVRGRLPGGAVLPQVYLALDRLCGLYGNNTLRITTPRIGPDEAPCRYAYTFKITGAGVVPEK